MNKWKDRFKKKFVKKQNILDASPDNKIIYGIEPPVDEIKQFIESELNSLLDKVEGIVDTSRIPGHSVCGGINDHIVKELNKLRKEI